MKTSTAPTQMSPSRNHLKSLVGAAALVFGILPAATAATYYWNTTTTGTWANTNNWWTTASGTTNPATVSGSSDTVFFNGTGVNGATVVQLNADAAAFSITFNNTGTTALQNFDVTARTLNLGSGGITVASTAGNVTISTNLTLAANQKWTADGGRSITIAGTVSGASQTLDKGNGTLQFAAGSNASLAAIVTSGSSDFGLISATGGSLDVSGNISLGRSNAYGSAPTLASPISAATTSGLYVNGGALSAGSLSIGMANSSSSVRVDSGSLAVSGKVMVANHNNSGRWSLLHVNGGTFTSGDATDGIVISPNRGTYTNNGQVYLSGGVTTAEKIAFGAATDTKGGNGFLILGGGTLYLGTGGIVKASTTSGADLYNYTIGLTSGTLGAKDNWASSLNMTLGTNPTIKAADAADAAKNITLSGVLSGTGFTKTGGGTLTLGGTSTFTGALDLSNGTVELNPTGEITQGGSLTIQGSGSYTFFVNGGSATFTGAATLANNSGTSPFVHVNAGTFKAASFSMARTGGTLGSEPTQGLTNAGLYVQGASDVDITGNLTINGSNSSASARFDGGTVDVGGVVTIGLGNAGRWSVLDVNGATFTSTNTATGIQIGSANEGNALFLVRNGTATVEKITFNRPGTAALQGVARVNGGALYVGSGGIVTTGSNALFTTTVKLMGGTLGAKETWSSDVNVTLGTNPTIKAANAADAAKNITLGGVVSGTGFTKTGGGVLTLEGDNTYTGTTAVNAGTLVVNGNQSTATGNVTISSTGTRLKGSGTIGGDTTLNSGAIHSPGNSVGTQTFHDGTSTTLTYAQNSIFEWELGATLKDSDTSGAARGTDWDAVNVSGTLGTTGTGAIFRVVLDGTTSFANAFWQQNREWTDIFKTSEAGSVVNFASIFSSFQHYNYSGEGGSLADLGSVSAYGSFTIDGSSLTWTAVPEPTSALVGLVLTAGLWRRNRKLPSGLPRA